MSEPGVPFSTYRTRVREEWLDYNGHLHDASYAVVLSEANEELFGALGLSEDYRRERAASLFTVESHIRYLAECSLGQELTASTLLVNADARTVRLHTELRHADGPLVATGEYFYLHVDTSLGKVTPMPAARLRAVEAMRTAHESLPRPEHLGRGVAAPRAAATGGGGR